MKLELNFNNKDHRVAIAALATHTMDAELWEKLESFEYTDDPIVTMFQEMQELKMQNDAMKRELEEANHRIAGLEK